ncbi:M10 family metallopeptidase C-terminal domain-containing protein [Marinomonas gallaica]|uniref:M10 family metallopeptidase C-terminal domain-containing protein n=1 Tax=Marinomonas gallaica TaxID=1806667 RepID=UPI003A8D4FCD
MDNLNYQLGSEANDYLNGSDNQNDALYGMDGHDTLYGKGGNDLLYGGHGNDYMSGGQGADTFRFKIAPESNPVERDVITDFDPQSGDLLWLSSWNEHTLNMELEQNGANLLITLTTDAGSYEATNEIILLGVQSSDFTTSCYDFYAHG